jgi:hypothetical protein
MIENILIITGETHNGCNMSKITKGYTYDQYAIIELIEKVFNYGSLNSDDFDLGWDIYTVIMAYVEDKLKEYPKLRALELYKNEGDCINKLFNIVTDLIPTISSSGENIHTLNEIYYTLNGQNYQFKSTLNDEEMLLELAKNFESISSLR